MKIFALCAAYWVKRAICADSKDNILKFESGKALLRQKQAKGQDH